MATKLSKFYRAAIQRHNDAQRRFSSASLAFRAHKINDEAYLAERAIYNDETAIFDAAYAVEQSLASQKSA